MARPVWTPTDAQRRQAETMAALRHPRSGHCARARRLEADLMAGQGFYDLAREHAEALEARKAQVEEAARIVPVYAVGSLEYAEQQRRLAQGEE